MVVEGEAASDICSLVSLPLCVQLPDNLPFSSRLLLSGTTSWIHLALPFLWDSSFVSGWADPPCLPLLSQQPWSWVSASPWLLYLIHCFKSLGRLHNDTFMVSFGLNILKTFFSVSVVFPQVLPHPP